MWKCKQKCNALFPVNPCSIFAYLIHTCVNTGVKNAWTWWKLKHLDSAAMFSM